RRTSNAARARGTEQGQGDVRMISHRYRSDIRTYVGLPGEGCGLFQGFDLEVGEFSVLGRDPKAEGTASDLAVLDVVLLGYREVEDHGHGLPAAGAGERMVQEHGSLEEGERSAVELDGLDVLPLDVYRVGVLGSVDEDARIAIGH